MSFWGLSNEGSVAMKSFLQGSLLGPVLMGLLLLSGCSRQEESLLMVPQLRPPAGRQLLVYNLDIPRGTYRTLHLAGSVLDLDIKNYCDSDVLVILRFYDKDGKFCGIGDLRPTNAFKEKAGSMFLAGGGGERRFSRKVRIPVAAVRVEIGMARYAGGKDRNVELHDFKEIAGLDSLE